MRSRLSGTKNTLKTIYRQELKPKLRKELLRSGSTISILENLYNKIERINAEFYGLAIELKRRYKDNYSNS